MAAEVGSAPVNGYGHNAPASNTNTNAPAQTDVTKEQVAWYFVESYYTTMSQNPEKLHVRVVIDVDGCLKDGIG